jgi:hypothetical protein
MLKHLVTTSFLLAVGASCGGCGGDPDLGPQLPEFAYLTAGLDVEASPPEGWTDVVIKLVPKLSASGGGSFSEADREGVSYRTVMLADVAPPARRGEGYTLRRVGIGNSLPIKGRDTVVTMGARERLGVGLTKATKFALYTCEEDLQQSRLLTATPTFALVGTQARLKVGSSYRKVQLRYAVSVDPATGKLGSAVWPVDAGKGGPSMVVLSGDPVANVPVVVMLEHAVGLVPKGVGFGMTELPAGRSLAIPLALAKLAARDRYSPQDAADLESTVRPLIRGDGPVAMEPTGGPSR